VDYARLAVVCAVGSSLGCGLRTVPIFEASTDSLGSTDSETDSDTEQSSGSDDGGECVPMARMEGDMGTCMNPIELPTTDSSAQGTLCGQGLYGDAACGPDGGLEDVYHFKPTVGSDVTISFDPAGTDFPPSVRILEYECMLDAGRPKMCSNDFFDGDASDPRHFLAIGNRDYYIHVDSEDGNGGDYRFSVTLGPPPLEQCEVHTETIYQSSGSVFQWQNDFPAGSGRVDSGCQGIGGENMFTLSASYPGNMYIDVIGSNGHRPLISVRSGCGATTELDCTTDAINGTPGIASLVYFIPGPGTYYIVADNLGLSGGTYDLSVAFD
jgi:hypothetical protein